MKLLMLGVSLATLAIGSSAHAGRYVVHQCSPNQNREKWFLIFDTQESTVNFSKAGSEKPRYGLYTMSYGITYTSVTNDTAAPMDLKLRPNLILMISRCWNGQVVVNKARCCVNFFMKKIIHQ